MTDALQASYLEASMADLAGFDVIFEIHKDTVVDGINLIPIPDPSGDGVIRLLGGPFSVELAVVVPQVGRTTVSLILEITLEPVVHQSVVRLLMTLRSGSCTLAGRAIDHIGGSLTLVLPLVFQLAPSTPPPIIWQKPLPDQPALKPWQIVLQTPSQVTCQLDAVTQAKIGAAISPDGVNNFCNGLMQAISWLVGPVIPLPVPYLKVVPGVDSTDPFQLSAVPIVAWIDAFTLGVFGYYSSASGGGSVSAKTQSDLDQPNEEFIYDLPPPNEIMPARRLALLISASAAHRVLLCPLVRETVVRELWREQKRNELFNFWFGARYQYYYADETAKHLSSYYLEELKKEDPALALLLQEQWDTAPPLPGLPWPFFGHHDTETERQEKQRALERAQARVQADVLADIWADADSALQHFLPPRDSDIAAATPRPCGTGSVEAFRKPIDEFSVQSDFIIGTLREFDIVPDDGRLMVHYVVETFIKDFFGDVKPSADGDIEIKLEVTYSGAIFARVKALEPHLHFDASGLTGIILDILKAVAPGTWQDALTIMGLLLQQKLQDAINQGLQGSKDAVRIVDGLPTVPVAGTAVQTPLLAGRAVDVQITKDSIALIGLIAIHPNYNIFNPALLLTIEKSLTASAQHPIDGSLHLPATDWGCPDTTFSTKRVFWDTEIRVKARPRDLTLPLTIDRWTIEIGNFTVNSFMVGGEQALVPDPRPRWSGAPAQIKSGALRLSGVINHPDPPLRDIGGGPFPLGHLSNTDIEATVAGSDNTGWSIRFLGKDGNFFVRVMLEATDGDNVLRHGETFVEIQGDELQLPEKYSAYKADCDAKYKVYSELTRATELPQRAPFKPGPLTPGPLMPGPLMPGQGVLLQQAARDISRLVQAGDPAATARLKEMRDQYGPDVMGALPLLASGSGATRGG
jgi:hypothetical protein